MITLFGTYTLFWLLTIIIVLSICWNIYRASTITMESGYGYLANIAVLICVEVVVLIAWFLYWLFT